MADLQGSPYYIPISRARVKEALLNQEGLPAEHREGLRRLSKMLESIWHHDALNKLERFNLLKKDTDGVLTVVSIDQALQVMGDYWGNIHVEQT